MINWNVLGNGDINWNDKDNPDLQAYKNLVWNLLRQTEGTHGGTPYWDSVGKPTIGVGFNFSSASLDIQDQVIRLMGFTLDEPSQSAFIQNLRTAINSLTSGGSFTALDDVMSAAHAAGFITKSKFIFTADELSSMQDTLEAVLANANFEARVNNFQTGIDASPERAALLSLGYVNAGLLGPKLQTAVTAGDRAEAWFEIRYDSNGGASRLTSGEGIAKRRFLESELFGIYHKFGEAVSQEDANQVFQMMNKHRADIFTEEKAFPNSVSLATRDYHLDSLVVHSLKDSLAPAF